MIKTLQSELKNRFKIIPDTSKMVLSANRLEYTTSIKQFITYGWVANLYSYLFGSKLNDPLSFAGLQENIIRSAPRVIKAFTTVLNTNQRNGVFNIFTDYMDLYPLEDAVKSLSDEHEKATGYLLLLCMLGHAESETEVDSQIFSLPLIVDMVPSNYLIYDIDNIKNILSFRDNFYAVVPLSRNINEQIDYIEQAIKMLMDDTILRIVKSSLKVFGSRRGGSTGTQYKHLMWMADAEIVALIRKVSTHVIYHFNNFHVGVLKNNLQYIRNDKSYVLQYTRLLYDFASHMIDIKGIYDTVYLTKEISSAPEFSAIKDLTESVESIRMLNDIVNTIVQQTIDPKDTVQKIIKMIERYMRDEIVVETNITHHERLLLKDESLDIGSPLDGYTSTPDKWFDRYVIPWADTYHTDQKVVLKLRKLSTENTLDTITERYFSKSVDIISLHTNDLVHEPIPIQLDRLDLARQKMLLVPVSLPHTTKTMIIVDEFNKYFEGILDSLMSTISAQYEKPVSSVFPDDKILEDLDLLVNIRKLTQTTYLPAIKSTALDHINIFDSQLMTMYRPYVIPSSIPIDRYIRYQIVNQTDFYTVVLIPVKEDPIKEAIPYSTYMFYRKPSEIKHEVSLSYPSDVIRSIVGWQLSNEFAIPTRIETGWISDFDRINRLVTKRNVIVYRLSTHEIIARRKFREYWKFINMAPDKSGVPIRPFDMFKVFYNIIRRVGSGSIALDNLIGLYGEYDSHVMFALKNTHQTLPDVVTPVTFLLARMMFTEQSAIQALKIPDIFGSDENIAYAKDMSRLWFTSEPTIDYGQINSSFDKIKNSVEQKLTQSMNLSYLNDLSKEAPVGLGEDQLTDHVTKVPKAKK